MFEITGIDEFQKEIAKFEERLDKLSEKHQSNFLKCLLPSLCHSILISQRLTKCLTILAMRISLRKSLKQYLMMKSMQKLQATQSFLLFKKCLTKVANCTVSDSL